MMEEDNFKSLGKVLENVLEKIKPTGVEYD